MSNDLKGILREKILNAVEEHIKNCTRYLSREVLCEIKQNKSFLRKDCYYGVSIYKRII